jgi:hypothetical protein
MKDVVISEANNFFMMNPYHLNADYAYLNIEVRRNLIIEDTLNGLIREGINFRKPLKIKFVNEPGVDEGGVQKEFF